MDSSGQRSGGHDDGCGRRFTLPHLTDSLPYQVSAYAMRDLNALQRKASAHGTHLGAYAAAVLEHPLPWTKMRHVYRLPGLVRRHGADAVDDACRRAPGRRRHRRRAQVRHCRLRFITHDSCVHAERPPWRDACAGPSRPRPAAAWLLRFSPRAPKTDEETYRPMDRDALTASVKQWLRPVTKRLPARLRSKIIRNLPGHRVRWGSLRRTRPFSS